MGKSRNNLMKHNQKKRTSKMNKQQRTFCEMRIHSKLCEMEKAIRAKHLIRKAKKLSDEEKLDVLRKNCSLEIGDAYYASRAFDFSAYEWPDSYDEQAIEAEMKPLRKRADDLLMQFMLGDAAEALELLRAFEDASA